MKDEPISAYPLHWPVGWQRTSLHKRTRARFNRRDTSTTYRFKTQLSVHEAVKRVLEELSRMGVSSWNVVISSNLETRNDGMPRSNAREPDDPGIAIYWRTRNVSGQRKCMAIDRYDRAADNLAAIAATLDAMRSIERHGGAEILDRAFTGFVALPAPEQPWNVLAVGMAASREEIEAAYRRLAFKHHPDRGGDAGEMARVNVARDAMFDRLSQL